MMFKQLLETFPKLLHRFASFKNFKSHAAFHRAELRSIITIRRFISSIVMVPRVRKRAEVCRESDSTDAAPAFESHEGEDEISG
jgi:hypothetical protein